MNGGHNKPRLWTWIAAGTAVALAGTSTALWLISDSKFDEQHDKCFDNGMKGCAPDSGIDTSAISSTQTAYVVTGVLAAVAGAAAVTLFFVEGSASEDAPSVAVGLGSVYARGRF